MTIADTDERTATRPLRRDARIRRDALLQAATECFAEQGYHVALEEIAERAGVGRGTLYRNFKDRMALVHAIFEKEVERFDVSVDPDEPIAATMMRMVLEGVRAHALFARLASDMPLQGENLAAFEALGRRFAELMEPAVQAARHRGEIGLEVGGRQLAVALRMVGGLLNPMMTEAQMRVASQEGIELLLRGMAAYNAGPRRRSLGDN